MKKSDNCLDQDRISFDPKYLDPRYFWSTLEDFSLSAFDEELLQEIPTTLIALTTDDIVQLTSNLDLITKGEMPEDFPHRSEIENAIKKYGGKAFFKLSLRSPKDSLFYKIKSIKNQQPTELVIENATELYQCLFTSMRTVLDIMRSLLSGIPIYIVLRQHVAISRWQEFRCFVLNGILVGVSQYSAEDFFPELQGNEDLILRLIRKKIKSIFGRIPDTCILDVFIQDFENVIVLEMNPFGCGASASLYHNGNHEDLDRNGWDYDMFREPIMILSEQVGS